MLRQVPSEEMLAIAMPDKIAGGLIKQSVNSYPERREVYHGRFITSAGSGLDLNGILTSLMQEVLKR